jgi:metallophosphoesterase (TIGR00282 family)
VSTYRILFLGDIVGRPGRNAVRDGLPKLMNDHKPLFVIVNGENSASGVGITPDIAEDLFNWGVDGITLGNHAFNKREIQRYLDTEDRIIRPGNMAPGVPGRGAMDLEKDGVTLRVINLCGRVFLDGYDDPFREVDRLIEASPTSHILIDFHAEATSEKIAFAWHVDGRATAVVGTHTHVPTADERMLPGGTAAITDVGMCGPIDSVLGMSREIILRRFLLGLPERFEVAETPGVISGVSIDVERDTGRAVRIERLRVGNGH